MTNSVETLDQVEEFLNRNLKKDERKTAQVELFILKMFMVEYACGLHGVPESVINDYRGIIQEEILEKDGEENLSKLINLINERFSTYDRVLKTEKEPNSLYWLGKTVAKYIFGGKLEYLKETAAIAGICASVVKATEETLEKFYPK